MYILKKVFIFTAILALFSVSCNFFTGLVNQTQQTVITEIVPMTPAVTQPAASENGIQSTEVPANDKVTSFDQGLENLASYRSEMHMQNQGVDLQGQNQTAAFNFIQEYITASQNKHVTINSESSSGTSGTSSIEFFLVDGTTYLLDTEEDKSACITFTNHPSMLDEFMKPTSIFTNLQALEPLEQGVVMGDLLTDHYTFDENALQSSEFETASGEVWIAQDGGFIVKFIGSGTGAATFGWEGTGTTSWDYQITEINTIRAIMPPETCNQTSGVEIPIPENATNISSFDLITTFESPDSPDTILEFYKVNLNAGGWVIGEELAVTGLVQVTFTKDNKSLNITITESNDGSQVMIFQEP